MHINEKLEVAKGEEICNEEKQGDRRKTCCKDQGNQRCEICEEPAEDRSEKIGLTKVAPEDDSRIIDSNYQDRHSLTFTLIDESINVNFEGEMNDE